VPPEFDLVAEIIIPGNPFRMAQGHLTDDHPLSGLWIVLLDRHEPSDGACNLYAVAEKLIVPESPVPFAQEREITGYANIVIAD
jgi:hypothetical protein